MRGVRETGCALIGLVCQCTPATAPHQRGAARDSVVRAETGVGQPGVGAAVVPGGMVAVEATFRTDTAVTRLDFPLMVEIEPPPGSRYFWAQQFRFEGGDGGYIGAQSDGLIDGRWVGKIVIFSIWQAVGAAPAAGAHCEPFSGEGEGWSCRRAMEWRAGEQLRLSVVPGSGPGSWRGALHASGGVVVLGEIAIPGNWGSLTGWTGGFVEYFTSVAGCGSVPYARAVFGTPIANGNTAPTQLRTHTYGACAGAAASRCIGPLCVP